MTANLVLRSVGRVLWFAIAGALCMALVGIVAGAAAGALITVTDDFLTKGTLRSPNEIPWNWINSARSGAFVAFVFGATAGALAFAIAGAFAYLSVTPTHIFKAVFRLAWRSSLMLTTLGAALGFINAIVWGHLLNATPNVSTNPALRCFWSMLLGVIIGFVIGTFYGAIMGARP